MSLDLNNKKAKKENKSNASCGQKKKKRFFSKVVCFFFSIFSFRKAEGTVEKWTGIDYKGRDAENSITRRRREIRSTFQSTDLCLFTSRLLWRNPLNPIKRKKEKIEINHESLFWFQCWKWFFINKKKKSKREEKRREGA